MDEIRLPAPRRRRAPRQLDAAAYRDLADFRYVLRRFLAFSEVAAKSLGVTAPQYQAMLAVKVAPDGRLGMKDLAEQMLLLPNGAVQLVNRLARLGMVRRTGSATDGRLVFVELTAKGEKVVTELAGEHLGELVRHQPLLLESLRRLRRIAS